MDAQAGLMPLDLDLAKQLRKFSKKIVLVINKIDGVNTNLAITDFFNFIFFSIKLNVLALDFLVFIWVDKKFFFARI